MINHQDLQKISWESLRKNIAIVLQNTVLFSDTVRHNLKYGNENAEDRQLQETVKMSHCDDLLQGLPKGHDTVLTGSGENISQGKRQLPAIAMVFAADPRILILDEATSDVDTRTEKAFQNAMQRVKKIRTSIVIAHRLSAIRDSDIIVVKDHGKIVESSKHNVFVQMRRYYALYMTQYAGYAT